MMMTKHTVFTLLLFLFCKIGFGQYKINSEVQDFTLKNIDEQMITLSGLQDNKGAIIVFTCNHCPYAKLYEDRIIQLDQEFKDKGYPVLAINPNDPNKEPDDSFENMKKLAKEKSYTFPYLVDETQEVAKAFGATRTPHVYVLEKRNENYYVRYIGGIDNNPQNSNDVSKFYVKDALNDLIKGRTVKKAETKAIGCTIKWK